MACPCLTHHDHHKHSPPVICCAGEGWSEPDCPVACECGRCYGDKTLTLLPGEVQKAIHETPHVAATPQREDVWVLCDGVGQPCLKWVRHGEPTPSEKRRTELNDDAYGPYKWRRYALVPISAERNGWHYCQTSGCCDGAQED